MYEPNNIMARTYKFMTDSDIFLLGLHHGDGCLTSYRNSKGRLRFKYGSRLSVYPEWIQSTYCPYSKVSKCRDRDTFQYQVSSTRGIVDLLTSAGYSLHKHVDLERLKTVIQGRENLFLRGLLESDGCVSLTRTTSGTEIPKMAWWSADYPDLLRYLQQFLPESTGFYKNKQSADAYGKGYLYQLSLSQVTPSFVETFFSPPLGIEFPKELKVKEYTAKRTKFYKMRRSRFYER